jgi:ABC-type sugar transport system, permease component
MSSLAHTEPSAASRTTTRSNPRPRSARRSPMAPPRSFLWTRRIILTLLTGFVLLPVLVMISSSLKPLQDVAGEFRWIPSELTIQPYIDIWGTVPLAKYFVNSLIVAGAATVLSVVIAVFSAYAVSRYRFPGKRVFTITVLSTQMFPGILFLLPLFLIFVNIGNSTGIALYGSRGGLILTYLTFSLPFSIWMLIGYFDSIPKDLDEAALVDGCGPLGALFRVVVPAAVPGIVAVSVYAFMTAWGEVLFASVMTNDTTRTLAVGLQGYATQNDVYWNQVMAASLVVSVPVVAGFLLLQRYLVAGLTAGAVK